MENCEDDFVVVIVNDEETDIENQNSPIKVKNELVKEEVMDPCTVEKLIKAAQEHGEHIELKSIKVEPVSEDEYNENIESLEDAEDYSNDADYVPEQLHIEYTSEQDINASDNEDKSYHSFKLKKPWQRKSLVRDLIKGNPKFKKDQKALIATLVEIMRNIKAPPLPKDYFIMNDANFECSKCGAISETRPAVSRHYQEKHGKRYLQCFACGVDFRSTTNLYKHEKRCIAPDAVVVLKARATVLGRKARSRPFLQYDPNEKRQRKSKYYRRQFYCDQCSAVFSSKVILTSHLYHHQGIRPFRCKHCPHAYTSFTALTRHEKTHSNVQYICDHCQRSFKLKEALIAHMDTHLSVKKHACNECDRRYAQKSALTLHINRVHRNLPPPCACQICPTRFARMSLLKTHMQKAHGMLLMTRKMFFKSLPKMPDNEIEKAKVVLKSDEIQSYLPYTLQNNNLKLQSHNNKKEKETTEETKNQKLSEKNMKLLKRIRNQVSEDVKLEVTEKREFKYETKVKVMDDSAVTHNKRRKSQIGRIKNKLKK